MHPSINAFYSCLEKIKEIMSKIWLSPDTLKKEICSILSQVISFNEVTLSGETNNVSLYVILSDCILIYTPFCDINDNIIIKRLNPILHTKMEVMYVLYKKIKT